VIGEIAEEYAKFPLRFTAGGCTDNGRLEVVQPRERILPDRAGIAYAGRANILGWRADTAALLKELNAPVYRWPGGNFVTATMEGRHRRSDRPTPRKNPAWKGSSTMTWHQTIP